MNDKEDNIKEMSEKWANELTDNIITKNPTEDIPKRRVPSKCRFCGGDCSALNNNGIIGPGYAEWNYACNQCGKFQGR